LWAITLDFKIHFINLAIKTGPLFLLTGNFKTTATVSNVNTTGYKSFQQGLEFVIQRAGTATIFTTLPIIKIIPYV
jgi:hypothetical protein